MEKGTLASDVDVSVSRCLLADAGDEEAVP